MSPNEAAPTHASSLGDLRVIDTTTGIAGAYCAKLFSDAGADVLLLEATGGHPLRRWTCSGPPVDDADGALFEFLRGGQRSATTLPDHVLRSADIVIVEPDGPLGAPAALSVALPGAVVVSISPYGLTGPYSDRPWSELTLQAEAGSVGVRGRHDGPPLQMGGHLVEWVSGAYGAAAALGAAMCEVRPRLVDLSMLEVCNTTSTLFSELSYALRGSPDLAALPAARTYETPSIEPTLDGYVGFNTNTRLQFEAFLLMIERADLLDGPWASLVVRQERWDEWNQIVRAWTTQHTTAEIVQLAAELRIPVAPVGDAGAILALDHLQARGVYQRSASDRFDAPRRPWLSDRSPVPSPRRAPAVGEHNGVLATQRVANPAQRMPADGGVGLPLAGIRVLDLTAWWAGPSCTGVLAALGADVIHVESTGHPDGIRMAGASLGMQGEWWERSGIFLQANANKRGITLDLATEIGRDVLLRLLPACDVVVENFTPRVLAQLGLDVEVLRGANPNVIVMRMPAFGLDGPWRDRPGFAQTMEQLTGLAWVNGFADDQPRIQRGPCDPNAGMHAAFACLVAVRHRRLTGDATFIEVPMVEAALNVAAETVIEWTAYGNSLSRMGNRSHRAAPQGVYRCAGADSWLAVSVASASQWEALGALIGIDPQRWPTAAARVEGHDQIDGLIGAWAAVHSASEAASMLLDVGVPAAEVIDPRSTHAHPQLKARGYYETVDHPVTGPIPLSGLPFQFSGVERWIRRHPPTMGEHNVEVLADLAGCSREELDALTAAGVIGTRPNGF